MVLQLLPWIVLLLGWPHLTLSINWSGITRVPYTPDFDPETSMTTRARVTSSKREKKETARSYPLPYACMVCKKDYQLASRGRKADRVAILPGCQHHFHASCLQSNFRLQEANPGRARLKFLDFVPVTCPSPTCKVPFNLYSSTSQRQSLWHNSCDHLLDAVDYCCHHLKKPLSFFSKKKKETYVARYRRISSRRAP
ncbi:hypothetical protein PCASD_15834 [Puccinia coronata f. sp. avenae]|uniref:RING-type domain-containing protein n=2 Tax=Puccinia coronata f. sp. avenae TaxID=200324 RepID=A0A2N5T5V8_9BASI|nr:hypothetical protein PCASD_15834 [Puccinia coronata f. sp. avenae]